MSTTRRRRPVSFQLSSIQRDRAVQEIKIPREFTESSRGSKRSREKQVWKVKKLRRSSSGVRVPGYRIPRSSSERNHTHMPSKGDSRSFTVRSRHSSTQAVPAQEEPSPSIQNPQEEIQRIQQEAIKSIQDPSQWNPRQFFPPLHLNLFMRANRFLSPSNSSLKKQKDTSFSQLLREQEKKLSAAVQPSDLKLGVRFRGGSAIESLPASSIESSFKLYLFQQGFSVNDPYEGWRPYDRTATEFLESIDAGILPISARTSKNTYTYYEGYLVVDIYDYRFITESSETPKPRRVLLKPCPDSLAADVEFLARRLFETKKYNKSLNDLKIEIEKGFLNVQNPHVCFDPSIRVLQTASLAYYNRRQGFVRRLEKKWLWNPKINKLRGNALKLQTVPFTPSSKRALFPLRSSKEEWNTSPQRKKSLSVLKFANFDWNMRHSRSSKAQNALLNGALMKATVFDPSPALLNQSHVSSVSFVHKNAHRTVSSGRYPRITIRTQVHPKPPNERPPPDPLRYSNPVVPVRYYSQSPISHMHDLFVFSQSQSSSSACSGVHDGLLKITRDGKPSVNVIKFRIGNKNKADVFLETYQKQCEREGRFKIHLKEDEHLPLYKKQNESFQNFVSLDAFETETQRREVEAKNRHIASSRLSSQVSPSESFAFPSTAKTAVSPVPSLITSTFGASSATSPFAATASASRGTVPAEIPGAALASLLNGNV